MFANCTQYAKKIPYFCVLYAFANFANTHYFSLAYTHTQMKSAMLRAPHTELELALELELAQTFLCTQNI